jgi:hypothetical protein
MQLFMCLVTTFIVSIQETSCYEGIHFKLFNITYILHIFFVLAYIKICIQLYFNRFLSRFVLLILQAINSCVAIGFHFKVFEIYFNNILPPIHVSSI